MKAKEIESALNLSALELDEVVKIKEHLVKIVAKDFYINHVRAGFAYLEISVRAKYTDYAYRVEQDGTTYIDNTLLGLIQVTSEVGEVLLNVIRNKQENNEYMDIKLLPL